MGSVAQKSSLEFQGVCTTACSQNGSYVDIVVAANVGSSQDVKEVKDEGTENVAGKVVEAPKVKVAGEPISSGPPYTKPSWSAAPGCPFKLEVLKEGVVMGNYDV